MVLLPDMTFYLNSGEHILSLQDPYTLDGKLITACEITEEPEYVNAVDALGATITRLAYSIQRTVKIINEDSFTISLSYEFLANMVRTDVSHFFREHESIGNVIRVGESGHAWDIERHYNESDYLRDIQRQCERIYVCSSGYSYAEMCRNRLRNQGRMPRRERIDCFDSVNLSTYDDLLRSWSNSITNVSNSDTWTISFDESLDTATSRTTTLSKKYIHQYNYKPEYIKHYMPDEDETTLLLGAEIEVDCGGESEEHAKNVLEIMCGKYSDNFPAADDDKEITMPVCVTAKRNEVVKLKEGYIKNTIVVCGLDDNGIIVKTYSLSSISSRMSYSINDNDEIIFPTDENELLSFDDGYINNFMITYTRKVNAKELINKANDYPGSLFDDVKEDKMYCTHDGSLRNGIEFDTMPCTLKYHKNEMNYKEMFKYLDEHGYKAHDTDTCGLHVHANRSYLGKSELMQQLTISKILYILEKFNDEICVIARRNNRYSQFMGKGKDEKSIVELYGKYKSGINNKYVALNLQHDETIEFRCFKSTLKYETFILTLEFVKNIIDYAKSINIEEVELIKWSDLMDTFSDELKEYYNTRLEKENKKEKEEKSSSSNINLGSGTIYFSNGTIISGVDAVSTVSDCNGHAHRVAYNFSGWSDLFESVSVSADSFSASLNSLVLGASSSTTNGYREDTVESLKKEIKSLKKKIKNCNNYMERVQLNDKLSRKQKELKKLKRERRQNNNT